jgi:hypothetical protein
MTRSDHGLTRRGALRGLGGAGLGLAGLGLFGPKDFEDEAYSATPSCTLVAEQEEGPYYLDLDEVRKNITEGKSGVRLDLRIKIVDSTSCDPLKDVAVDIWHCAANGKYSGFSAEGTSGETFLRGIQLTDEDGIAAFRTIYPGWYQGRATHIHLKAHVDGHVSHTGQLFFRDATTDKVARLSLLLCQEVDGWGCPGRGGAASMSRCQRRRVRWRLRQRMASLVLLPSARLRAM